MHNIDLAAFKSDTLFLVIPLILIGLAVGTIILRAACSLYNRCAGGPLAPKSIPMPGLAWSFAITCIRATVNNLVRIGIVMGLTEFAGPAFNDRTRMILLGELISSPITLVISAGIVAASLPTTFLRGFGVSLLELGISIVVVVIIGVISVLISMAPFTTA